MNYRKAAWTAVLITGLAVVTSGSFGARPAEVAQAATAGKTATIEGYVVDSACAFVRNVQKPRGEDCALKCARAGSPLVILANDGTLYWPISSAMPAVGENPRMMKYAGQRVSATGAVYQRSGAHAIVIEKIVVIGK
ncbi:MAG TPA: hypothetical protein VGW33_10670 [Terriglobia bacterium]|nr:hypothetical protein [Terriglobia bacterium]